MPVHARALKQDDEFLRLAMSERWPVWTGGPEPEVVIEFRRGAENMTPAARVALREEVDRILDTLLPRPPSGKEIQEATLVWRNQLIREFIKANYTGSANAAVNEFMGAYNRYLACSWLHDRDDGLPPNCPAKRRGLFAIAEALRGKSLKRSRLLEIFGSAVEKSSEFCGS